MIRMQMVCVGVQSYAPIISAPCVVCSTRRVCDWAAQEPRTAPLRRLMLGGERAGAWVRTGEGMRGCVSMCEND